MISRCPVCDSSLLHSFLSRQNVPVHQNVLFHDRTQAQLMPRGNLSLAVCCDCGFVFNTSFLSQVMTYDQTYENTQNYSTLFDEYVNGLIDYLVHQRNVVNSRIIEVGCGKGTFLRKLVERGNNYGMGFDPSYIGPLEDLSGKLVFKKEFYDDRYSELPADVIVCRHVIEHISDPVSMLISIRKAVQNSENVLVVFETPDVEWIFRNSVVADFFYEHCSYFSSHSISVAFERAGFQVETVKKVFGGQYLWVEARPGPTTVPPTQDGASILGLAEDFGRLEANIRGHWKEELINLSKGGKVMLWGAGAKGVTFCNLFDPHMEYVHSLVDVNPNKQGMFLPGTGHPIISPEELAEVKDLFAIIVMNPNYHDEVEAMLSGFRVNPNYLIDFSPRSEL